MSDRVVATAPVRVCDVGGWTDTWFGSPGQVCSVAVEPGVTVTAERIDRPTSVGSAGPVVHLVAPDIGVDQWFGPSSGDWATPSPSIAPLLELAVGYAVEQARPASSNGSELTIAVTVGSAVPPGASLGTSAAVLVAVLAAVGGLLGPGDADLDGPEIARAAHVVETRRAGREAGVQDHWAAALGGPLNLVIDTYPDVRWTLVDPPAAARSELAGRLVTVVLGAHDSSAVHGEVIRALLSCDGAEHDRVRRATRELASLAGAAADALRAGDMDRWAGVLTRSTDVQADMHPGLVGPGHRRAIEAARSAGAVGWKVNGAGGDGGSLTVVAPPDGGAVAIRQALRAADPTWQVVDLSPATTGVTLVRG